MNALPFIVVAWGAGFALSAALATALSRLKLRSAPTAFLLISVAVSAVGAGFTSGRPTAVSAVNVVMRTVLAAVFVVAASIIHPRQLVLATFVLAVPMGLSVESANLDPWVVAVGVGSVGAALALYLHPSCVPILGGMIGALTAQSALRLPTTLPSRTPSLVAAVAGLVLVVAAWPNLDQRLRRGLRLGTFGVLAVGSICAIAGSMFLLSTRVQVERGVTAAKVGLAFAGNGETKRAEQSLHSARIQLQGARKRLESPWARVGLVVPVLAQHIFTVHDLTRVAVTMVSVAEQTVSTTDVRSLKAERGRIDVQRMRALLPQMIASSDAIASARTALSKARGPWLLGPLTRRIAPLEAQVNEAAKSTAEIRQIVATVPAMLGADRERRYLLVLPSPAEARGSGGVVGNFGEITAVNGKISLVRFGRQSELSSGGTPPSLRHLQAPADYVKRYTPFGASNVWSNMTMSPDFPSVAEAMANHYPQSGGRAVDGVISADPFALQRLLGLLGPLKVTGWDEPLDGTNAARVLLHDAYVVKGGSSPERLALLSEVAQGAWQKLAGATFSSPKDLVDALAPAAAERHLQIWMRDNSNQSYLTKIGLAGNVAPVAGDGFGVVVNNASANKIEFYLHRTIAYSATIDPANGTVRAAATIALRNDAPSTGLPDYIIGNRVVGEALPPGTNRLYVSLYSPLALVSITVDGRPVDFTHDTELGRNVYSVWLTIPAKSQVVLKAILGGPIVHIEKEYRLDVFGQPLVNVDHVSVTVASTGRDLVPGQGFKRDRTGLLRGTGGSRRVQTFIATYR